MAGKLIDYLALAGLLIAIIFAVRYYSTGQNETIVVVVVDGDSLRLNGRDIRLFGIDAPEYRQSCRLANGTSYRCGRDASTFLRKLVSGRPVKCRQIDIDRYDREISTCTAGETDLNQAMVESGWAVAYLRYSSSYAGAERQARKTRRGIWRGKFTQPENWRRQNR